MADKYVRALVLFSGGLDSILAAKILMVQGIEVTGISFISNFYSAARAKKAARQLGIKLKIIDISSEMLELAKNPPSGYGKNMNPCLDCHALMIKKAKGIGKKEGYNFLATGEVLGQRPFSQNRQALAKVIKLAGIEVLRPLSAKLLPETEMEKSQLVDRNKLLDISGRTRDRQMKLAEEYGIKEYPSPASGCLLTDPAFSQRFKTMLKNWPQCTEDDVELIKRGRVFWLTLKNRQNSITEEINKNKIKEKILVVVGRNEAENLNLTNIAKRGDFMVELKNITGPLAIIRIKLEKTNWKKNKLKNELVRNIECGHTIRIKIPNNLNLNFLLNNYKDIIKLSAVLTGYYATKARGKEVECNIRMKN